MLREGAGGAGDFHLLGSWSRHGVSAINCRTSRLADLDDRARSAVVPAACVPLSDFPNHIRPNCHPFVKAATAWNLRPGCESTPCQSERLRPKNAGRIRKLHHVSNCLHKGVKLLVGHHKWRSYFQNHEVVSTNLRQESGIAKKTHHHDLPEHGWMYGPERLIRDAQTKLAGSLKFKPHQ